MERMDQEQVLAQVRKQAAGERTVRCAVCATEAAGSLNACAACGATYHSDCWSYNGGCAVYGCAAAPRRPDAIPIDVVPRRARWSRWAITGLGALACLFFGMAVGERNAAARAPEPAIEDDMLALQGTVEVMEGLQEIESLRTVCVRNVRADELLAQVRRRVDLDGQFPVSMLAEAGGRVIELRGPERMVSTVARLLRDLDVPQAMLMIEARVMVADAARARAARLAPDVAPGAPEAALASTLWSMDQPSAASVCDLLERAGYLRTLAAPRMQTADGKLAEIAIGDSIIASTAPGRRAASHETGVRVAVLPRFRADGRVDLDLELELSGVEAAAPGPLAGLGAVAQDGRAVVRSHGLVIADGQEAVLSGLAAPRFGPVPDSQGELLVLLTAHKLAPPQP